MQFYRDLAVTGCVLAAATTTLGIATAVAVNHWLENRFQPAMPGLQDVENRIKGLTAKDIPTRMYSIPHKTGAYNYFVTQKSTTDEALSRLPLANTAQIRNPKNESTCSAILLQQRGEQAWYMTAKHCTIQPGSTLYTVGRIDKVTQIIVDNRDGDATLVQATLLRQLGQKYNEPDVKIATEVPKGGEQLAIVGRPGEAIFKVSGANHAEQMYVVMCNISGSKPTFLQKDGGTGTVDLEFQCFNNAVQHRGGMSGGGIFNSRGELVGTSCRGSSTKASYFDKESVELFNPITPNTIFCPDNRAVPLKTILQNPDILSDYTALARHTAPCR